MAKEIVPSQIVLRPIYHYFKNKINNKNFLSCNVLNLTKKLSTHRQVFIKNAYAATIQKALEKLTVKPVVLEFHIAN